MTLNETLQTLYYLLSKWRTVLDFIIVYFLIYRFLIWIKNTHAFNLIRGLIGICLVYFASHLMGLMTLNWILGKFATIVLLLLIIIFQPELRRFLENIGALSHLFSPLLEQKEAQGTTIIKQILKAVDHLSKEKIGALLVIEVATNLNDYIESGVKINGTVTSDLITSLFWPGSPTHDGAIIIRENRIEAAGCLLPLTDSKVSDRRLGTRHIAALGLSELSDAIIIVVSEETGIISMAEKGDLTRYLTKETLETRLFNLYKVSSELPKIIKHPLQYLLRKKENK